MVAPAVLITMGGILSTGLLMNAYGVVADRMFGLTRERLGILSGQDGELLDATTAPAADRERLTEIDTQMPLVMRRIRRLRNAAVLLYSGVGLVVLGVIAIAVAVTSRSQSFGYIALALVLAGTVAEFAATTTAAIALLQFGRRTQLRGRAHTAAWLGGERSPVVERESYTLRAHFMTGQGRWEAELESAGHCTRPIRLAGRTDATDRAPQAGPMYDTASEPGGVLLVACGNRRERLCPVCSQVYKNDARQ